MQSGLLPRTLVPPPSAVPRAFVSELRNGFWVSFGAGEFGALSAWGSLLGSAWGAWCAGRRRRCRRGWTR